MDRSPPADFLSLADFSWLASQGLERLPEFLTSLSIRLLIGLERERNPLARARAAHLLPWWRCSLTP